jgi:hypothetical protein
MKLLADEHIPQDIIAAISTAGFSIDSVREKFRGFKDIELISHSLKTHKSYTGKYFQEILV